MNENLSKTKLLKPRKSAWSVYDTFIKHLENNSKDTARAYDQRIREFFTMTAGTDIERLSIEDIKAIDNSMVKKYYVDVLLNQRGNKEGTIITKLNTVSSYFQELQVAGHNVNHKVLKVKLKTVTSHHKSLSHDELYDLFDFLKAEKQLGMTKYLAAKTLYVTANRKSAVFGMKWSDIKVKKDIDTGDSVYVIELIDKGKVVSNKPISNDFYEELLNIKSETDTGEDLVFKIHPKTFERTIKKFDEDISIHSFKATAITLGYQMTKDLNLCKQLGNHSQLATTEIYIRDEKSYTKQLSYLSGANTDDQLLKEMGHAELMEFIEENKDIKRIIVSRLNYNKGDGR